MAKQTTGWQWRVAAMFVCGLFLLNVSSTVWAASKKPSDKAASAKQAKKPTRHVTRPVEAAPEFGPADLIEDGVPGLRGHASFYGHGFQGRKTATGDVWTTTVVPSSRSMIACMPSTANASLTCRAVWRNTSTWFGLVSSSSA
jgi:hypothetical protein